MMSSPCVVDASVGIKLFLNEDESELVAGLFNDHMKYPSAQLIAVPGFFYIECASVLRKVVRAGTYDAAQARRDLEDLRQMTLLTIPTIELAGAAFEISSIYGISAYDACYVALADRVNVPLLTADERLRNSLAGSPFTVQTITQYFTEIK